MSKKDAPLKRRKSTENAPNSRDKGPKSTGKKDPFSMEKPTNKPQQGNRK